MELRILEYLDNIQENNGVAISARYPFRSPFTKTLFVLLCQKSFFVLRKKAKGLEYG